MSTAIIMPKLGLNMTEGTLERWLAGDGEAVHKGQPLCIVTTEKVSTEVIAERDGVLLRSVPEGAVVPVLGVLGQILQPGESQVRQPQPAAPPGLDAASAQTPAAVRATPAVKRRAREAGIDLGDLVPSGPDGRITMEDVEQAVTRREGAAPEPAAGCPAVAFPRAESCGQVRPLRGARAVIAQRMTASHQQTAPVTLTASVDATEFVKLRSLLCQALPPGAPRISYNSMLVYVTAHALREYPFMNARLEGESILLVDDINVGVAVDTDRELLVPVLRQADRRGIADLERELQVMINRALQGQSLPDELTGGTFTITNLGSLKVDAFTPIINLPEAAILGVGRIHQQPAVYQGAICVRDCMTLSLTFDHRLTDGAPAARFLKRIKELAEEPGLLLL